MQVVMGMLLAALDMKVPPYVRTDAFLVSHRRLTASAEEDDGSNGAAVEVQVTSPHGPRCPMPMLSYVIFSFPVSVKCCFRSNTQETARETPNGTLATTAFKLENTMAITTHSMQQLRHVG